MICKWLEFIRVLPLWMRETVDKQGRDGLQELRLRLHQPPEMILGNLSKQLSGQVSAQDLRYTLNTASGYSPWAAASVTRGFITIPGGHRIGICGEAAIKDGALCSMRNVTSLCLRVARDFPGVARKLSSLEGSILIIGSPGCGKTTLLRDLIRLRAENTCVAVVDERCELFPFAEGNSCFDISCGIDILQGCSKPSGIDMVVRTMGPGCIAVDEITSPEDCKALLDTARCGVDILATAHARSISDLHTRPFYKRILGAHIFDHIVTLNRDKTYITERMNSLC